MFQNHGAALVGRCKNVYDDCWSVIRCGRVTLSTRRVIQGGSISLCTRGVVVKWKEQGDAKEGRRDAEKERERAVPRTPAQFPHTQNGHLDPELVGGGPCQIW